MSTSITILVLAFVTAYAVGRAVRWLVDRDMRREMEQLRASERDERREGRETRGEESL